MVASNTYGRQVVVPLTNKSGGSVAAGDVVIVDTTNNDAFTTTTSAASTAVIGVAQETIASNAVGRVLLQGYAALVNVNASVTRGHYGKTHTVAKQAADGGASRGVGTFCQFLIGGTTPDAYVYPTDLGAGSGFSPVIGYAAVATDQSTTSGSFTDLATAGPSVTITVNTKVKVTISADMYGTASDTAMNMGVDVSGATTSAPAEDLKLQGAYVAAVGSAGQLSRVLYYSGLTPGSTTFKAQYYRGGSGTAHWRYRTILVETLD